jgi:hypothetical protein
MRDNIRPPGWLVSVRTPSGADLYVVGADDRFRAQTLAAEHCNAGLAHTVRVERALTEGEVDRYELSLGEVKRFAELAALRQRGLPTRALHSFLSAKSRRITDCAPTPP